MNSVRWRNGVAKAIAGAVDGYFGATATAAFPCSIGKKQYLPSATIGR